MQKSVLCQISSPYPATWCYNSIPNNRLPEIHWHSKKIVPQIHAAAEALFAGS